MLVNILSAFALIFSLSGNILINYKKKIGFIVWIISNILWIAVNLAGEPNWCQIAMFIVYMALNVQGWLAWNKKK